MSHFSMFVPTKENVQFLNGNPGHDQEMGIILFCFPRCSIIYPVRPVYYCPDHPSNTTSLGDLKYFVAFQKVKYENLEHCDFVDPQG